MVISGVCGAGWENDPVRGTAVELVVMEELGWVDEWKVCELAAEVIPMQAKEVVVGPTMLPPLQGI